MAKHRGVLIHWTDCATFNAVDLETGDETAFAPNWNEAIDRVAICGDNLIAEQDNDLGYTCSLDGTLTHIPAYGFLLGKTADGGHAVSSRELGDAFLLVDGATNSEVFLLDSVWWAAHPLAATELGSTGSFGNDAHLTFVWQGYWCKFMNSSFDGRFILARIKLADEVFDVVELPLVDIAGVPRFVNLGAGVVVRCIPEEINVDHTTPVTNTFATIDAAFALTTRAVDTTTDNVAFPDFTQFGDNEARGKYLRSATNTVSLYRREYSSTVQFVSYDMATDTVTFIELPDTGLPVGMVFGNVNLDWCAFDDLIVYCVSKYFDAGGDTLLGKQKVYVYTNAGAFVEAIELRSSYNLDATDQATVPSSSASLEGLVPFEHDAYEVVGTVVDGLAVGLESEVILIDESSGRVMNTTVANANGGYAMRCWSTGTKTLIATHPVGGAKLGSSGNIPTPVV